MTPEALLVSFAHAVRRSGVRVSTGDTIWTPPGVRHWHGAAPDRYMIHTGISLAGVNWQEPVTDEAYSSAGS